MYKNMSLFKFLFLICSINFYLRAMDVEQRMQQIIQVYNLLREMENEQPLLETVFHSCKYASTKVFELYYNYPKLCIGGTTVTLSVLALRLSGYWPLTKYDLRRFKKETLKTLSTQQGEFNRNTTTYSQDRAFQLAALINESNGRLNTFNTALSDAQPHITTFPNFVLEVAAEATESSLKEQTQLLTQTRSVHKDAVHKAYWSITQLLHRNEQEFSLNLTQLEDTEHQIEDNIALLLEKINQLMQEKEKETNGVHNALFNEHQAHILAINDQASQAHDLLQLVVGELDELEKSDDETFNEISAFLAEQERFLKNGDKNSLGEKLK